MTHENDKLIKQIPIGNSKPKTQQKSDRPAEIGGPKGPEPTRYGDWEKGGKCVDF